jgi:transcriptional regulator with XRE-family HTH domain
MQIHGSPRGASGAGNLGSTIRSARLRRDMTQEELALETGLARKTIYQVEHGQTDPRLGTLRRIADAIGVEIADLVGARATERCGPGGPLR